MLGNILGIVVLALDVFAILKIAQTGESTANKALWIALVIILPALGFVIWYLAGPGDKSFKV